MFSLPRHATFEEWWSLDIQAYVFGSLRTGKADDSEYLDVIIERLDCYLEPVDVLEEDYANRVTV